MNSIHALLRISIVGLALTSCVVTEGPGGSYGRPMSSSFGFYDVLPQSYVGNAYYHQNRYYYGGTYQRGNYHHHGTQYSDRYYHGGQYYYGGRNESHGNQGQKPKAKHSSRSNDRDRDHR